jgi:hypothetical protein
MRELTLGEEQLVELEEVLKRLVDANAFNAAVTLEIARCAGVDVPYGIDVVNDQTGELHAKIRSAFEGVFEGD